MSYKLQASRLVSAIAIAGAMSISAGVMAAPEVTQSDYGAFTETPDGPEFRLDFVIERMRQSKPISQYSVDALRTIARGGPSDYGDMISTDTASELALLLEAYGLDDIADIMRRSFGVAIGGSGSSVTSGSNIQDWGSGAAGSYNEPLGSTVRDEGSYMVVEDPPGGATLRNMTMNCLYRSTPPEHVDRPAGRYVQELTPPTPINAERLIERKRDGTKVEETFEVQSILFDASPGTVTKNRFRAYFYGRKILEEYSGRNSALSGGEAGYQTNQRPVQESPAWHSISCRTIHARP